MALKRFVVLFFFGLIVFLSILPNIIQKQMFPFNNYNMYVFKMDQPEVKSAVQFEFVYQDGTKEILSNFHPFFSPFIKKYYTQSIAQISRHRVERGLGEVDIISEIRSLLRANVKFFNERQSRLADSDHKVTKLIVSIHHIKLNQKGESLFKELTHAWDIDIYEDDTFQ